MPRKWNGLGNLRGISRDGAEEECPQEWGHGSLKGRSTASSGKSDVAARIEGFGAGVRQAPGRFRAFPRKGAGPSRTVPCRPRAPRHPQNFLGLEGSAQEEVKSAKIEHFRPEAVVGQARGHDEPRPTRRLVQPRQQEFPVAIQQTLLADHDRYFAGIAANGLQSIARRADSPQLPPRSTKDAFERVMIPGMSTNQQDRVWC